MPAREPLHGINIERPIQLRTVGSPQYGNPSAIACFEYVVVIDPG